MRPLGRDVTHCGTACYDSICNHAELSCPRTRKRPRSRFPDAGSSTFGRPCYMSSPWPNMPPSTPLVGLRICHAGRCRSRVEGQDHADSQSDVACPGHSRGHSVPAPHSAWPRADHRTRSPPDRGGAGLEQAARDVGQTELQVGGWQVVPLHGPNLEGFAPIRPQMLRRPLRSETVGMGSWSRTFRSQTESVRKGPIPLYVVRLEQPVMGSE